MSEDFEFKPLTEGLGFHKKVIDIGEKEDPTSGAHSLSSSGSGGTSPFHPKGGLQKPLIGRTPSEKWEPAIPKASMEEAPKIQRPIQLIPAAASWPAAIFDATMVLGLVLLFSAAVFAITHIDFPSLLEMLQNDAPAQLAAAVLVFSVFEIYSVACRAFFGKTLGEWAFEYRLGSYAQQQQILYPVRVAWRGFVTAITGFVLLPLLSTILHRDLAGIISGTPIFMEKR